MTVCIAAICDCGHKAVVAADRMFTFPTPLNIEFQTPEKKIEQIGTSCVVLSSGNGAYSTEITQAVTRLLNGNPNPPISGGAEILGDAYLQIRSIKVREQVIIAMLGPDYLKFEAMNVSLPPISTGRFSAGNGSNADVQLRYRYDCCRRRCWGARVAYVGNLGTLAWR